MRDLFFKDETAEVERLRDQYQKAKLKLRNKKDVCAHLLHKELCVELKLTNASSRVFLGRLMVRVMAMELMNIALRSDLNSQETVCANKVIDALVSAGYLENKGDGVYKSTAAFVTRLNELRVRIEAEWEAEHAAVK